MVFPSRMYECAPAINVSKRFLLSFFLHTSHNCKIILQQFIADNFFADLEEKIETGVAGWILQRYFKRTTKTETRFRDSFSFFRHLFSKYMDNDNN